MSKESIILIHLGPNTPNYLCDCIHQIRLWNNPTNVDIYLVLEPININSDLITSISSKYSVRVISTDSLERTTTHSEFIETNIEYSLQFNTNYWRHVTERFFYLEEVMRDYCLETVVHMEYDVLLYEDISILGPLLRKYIPNIGLPFDNDIQGCASFMVVNNIEALEFFNGFITANNNKNITDMHLLAIFRRNYPEFMSSLPQIPKELYDKNPNRISRSGLEPKYGSTQFICEFFNELGEILFDARAIGQYIGGVDPRNQGGKYLVKYINESSFYKVYEFGVQWKKDLQGRWYTVSEIPGEHKIINLHIHSKKLSHFLSDRLNEPVCDYSDGDIIKFQDVLETTV
jgi:hypothetical protein